MKRPTMFALVMMFALSPAFAQGSAENVSFKWAFGALAGPKKAFVPITRDTILNSGDEVKMLVDLGKSCFVYVVHEGPAGEITMFFPYSFKQFTTDYAADKNYYIPPGRDWIKFDKTTGKETFYLLAASERLTQLETLLTTYKAADKAKRPEIAQSIVNEIRDARRRFRSAQTLAEKPVTIGGNIRGVGEAEAAKRPDVADIATQISASNFYAKTVTIDHR